MSNKKRKNNQTPFDTKTRALYKAVSRIPISADSKLPVAYARSLPMIVGIITVFILMIVPVFKYSIFDNFVSKSEELVDYFSLSLRAGVSAYVDQMDDYINPLPLDTEIQQRLYGGRININEISKDEILDINIGFLSEQAHLMTARVSGIFDNLKP